MHDRDSRGTVAGPLGQLRRASMCGVTLGKELRLQAKGRAIGRWLGIFAIAMLFIGPPIGQWRAALQVASANGAGAQGSELHDRGAGHLPAHAAVHSPFPGNGHAHGPMAAGSEAAPASSVTQVGVLSLDHCGYCHLVACFAALPGGWAALPLVDWTSVPAVPRSYQAPSAPFVSIQRARAPPLQRA